MIIEKNVWSGEAVTILPGITIGQGSIIGANSVVSESILQHVIAVGNPAKPIKNTILLQTNGRILNYDYSICSNI